MNRAQRRAAGVNGKHPVLTITQAQLDQHMPHVKDGDLVQIKQNGLERVMRVEVVAATAKPH